MAGGATCDGSYCSVVVSFLSIALLWAPDPRKSEGNRAVPVRASLCDPIVDRLHSLTCVVGINCGMVMKGSVENRNTI